MATADGSENGDEGLASPMGELGTQPQRTGGRVIDLTLTCHLVGTLACHAEACWRAIPMYPTMNCASTPRMCAVRGGAGA